MSLATLFASKGTTAELVAQALGVSPFLFDRIDAGAQGLAGELVPRIAALLAVDPTDVVAAVSRVVRSKSWPRSGVARPARTDLGDPLPHVLLHDIPPVELPPRVPPPERGYVWATIPVAGEGGGSIDSPRIIVFDGANLFVGTSNQDYPPGANVYKLDVTNYAEATVLATATASVGNQTRDIAVDSAFIYATLWDASNVVIIDKATMAVVGYGYCGPTQRAVSVCCDDAGNFFVYVVGTYGSGAKIQRFSTAACIGAPPDTIGPALEYDGDPDRGRWIRYGGGAVWWFDGGNTNFGVRKLDPATMTPLGDATDGIAGQYMSGLVAFGSLWVGVAAGGNTRVLRFDAATLALQATIALPNGTPMEMSVGIADPSGLLEWIYVASMNGRVYAIDTTTDTLVFSTPDVFGYRFDGAAFVGGGLGGNLMFVAGFGLFGGAFVAVDAFSNQYLVTIIASAPPQYLVAVDRQTRTIASLRDLVLVDSAFASSMAWAIAFDGSRVWLTNTGGGGALNARTAATLADDALAPIDPYSSFQYGAYQTGMAAREYGDATSGLWKTVVDFGTFAHDLQRLDESDGSVLNSVPIFIGRFQAEPKTCTVIGGKVFTIAVTPVNGMSQVRFVRVDAASATQELVSTGYDFTSEFLWNEPQILQVAAIAGDALWIQRPDDVFAMGDNGSIIRCDVASMVVTLIPAVGDIIGAWAGGADADGDGNLWFTGVRRNEMTERFEPIISKVAPDGTVLAVITPATFPVVELYSVGPLVADPLDASVWAAVIVDVDGLRDVYVARIDAATASVTDAIFVARVPSLLPVDMVVGV